VKGWVALGQPVSFGAHHPSESLHIVLTVTRLLQKGLNPVASLSPSLANHSTPCAR
jgi:hypothetical protein